MIVSLLFVWYSFSLQTFGFINAMQAPIAKPFKMLGQAHQESRSLREFAIFVNGALGFRRREFQLSKF